LLIRILLMPPMIFADCPERRLALISTVRLSLESEKANPLKSGDAKPRAYR
jgi:hypothetical protein